MVESGKADEVTGRRNFRGRPPAPANIIEAAAQGTQTGVKLAVAVGAMVMVFVALVALANGMLGGIGSGIVALAAGGGCADGAEESAVWFETPQFSRNCSATSSRR